MKPNKILALANKQSEQANAKTWRAFKIKAPRPSVDPNLPPLYLVDVQGLRNDGVSFTIPCAIDKDKFDLLPAGNALEIAVNILMGGIVQLLTFTGCACTNDTECDEHRKPTLQ